jgi:5-methylcytosine-specific restriction endonuclease McrBC regulatory subunit McrC
MKGRIEFVKNVEKNVKLKKWKQTISLHEVSDELRLPKIVKCCVEIVIGEKVISNFVI